MEAGAKPMTETIPPQTRIPLPLDEIAALCRKYDVTELSVFGSVLRDDFGPDSDVDFLVTYAPDAELGPWLSRFFELQEALSVLVGRPVDLIERASVDQSENYIRRASILRSAEGIYAGR
jgi:predicted nucleotidyltransferase